VHTAIDLLPVVVKKQQHQMVEQFIKLVNQQQRRNNYE